MTAGQLEALAHTKRKDLPQRKPAAKPSLIVKAPGD